jgi:hypothetical protein
MSKFITKRMQLNLHAKYTYYREQYNHPHECHELAVRDLGLPIGFDIGEYTVVENEDDRAIDNSKDFIGIKRLSRLLTR